MIEIVTTEYQCEICETSYGTEKRAFACERGRMEPQQFFPGDIVADNIKYYDGHKPRGPVIRVARIELRSSYDEWMVKGLGKYRHIYVYAFKCACDECERRRQGKKSKKYGYIDTGVREQLSSLLILVKRKGENRMTKNRH